MARQYSTTVRTDKQAAIETAIGASPKLQLRTGAPPANCAAADTGTLIVEMTLPADWVTQSGGVSTKAGTWSAAATGAGTNVAGHYRIKNNAGSTTHEQGNVYQSLVIATNALTAANGNVLNFASTTGVVVGMKITGTGVEAETFVLALTGTTVTMSKSSTAGVANAASITFGGDLTLDNTSINNGQTVTISTYTITENGA